MAAALWAWDNGDLPIWITSEAIEALRRGSLTVRANIEIKFAKDSALVH